MSKFCHAHVLAAAAAFALLATAPAAEATSRHKRLGHKAAAGNQQAIAAGALGVTAVGMLNRTHPVLLQEMLQVRVYGQIGQGLPHLR